MRRLAALVLILVTVLFLRQYADGESQRTTLPMAFGFALIAASLLGAMAERVRLPGLTGYLVFGLLCGPYMLNLISASMARELQLANGLAIALIALVAGLEINIVRMGRRLWSAAAIALTTIAVMYAILATGLLVAWPWVPLLPAATGVERLAIILVFTTVLVSFSPTVTIAVIAESRARGPLADLVLTVTIVADLILILAFTLVMQFARTTSGTANDHEVALATQLAWEIGGSLAVGAIVGAAFAFYLRFVGRELTLVLLGVCAGISTAGAAWHVEPLLAALAAGLVIENLAAVEADALREAIERGARPVLIVFFAAAGASLRVDALATIGGAAAVLAVARFAAIRVGTTVGLAAARQQNATSRLLWMGLVSQAGVTLGLAVLVSEAFPTWGPSAQTLIIAMNALHALAGPIVFKSALARAGEIPEVATAPLADAPSRA